MKFPRMVNWRDPEHCQQLREEHIPNAPPFVAYTLHGSDEKPVQLDLYAVKPEYDTQPFCTYVRNEEDELTTDFDFNKPEAKKGRKC